LFFAICLISSEIFFGSGGRPGWRDFHRQKILNPVRCHLRKVSGLTTVSASRQSKNRASATIARRIDGVIPRGFILSS
jgi:hypothetical protein